MILNSKGKYIKVLLNLPLEQPFAYKVPAELSSRIQIGRKVMVPFKRQIISGFVVEEIERKESRKGLKEIIKVIDDFPPLSNNFMKLAKWISNYYCCSLGQALHSVFPLQETFRVQKRIENGRKTPTTQKFGKLNSIVKEYNEDIFLKEKGVFLFKTEDNKRKKSFYLFLVEKTLEKGKQIILIAPEISYLSFLQELIINSYYKGDIAILHSRLSSKKRYKEWYRINKGEVQMVIGTRSAVFAPFDRLGLIIVEEEENSAYKQIEAPRYHLREVAIKRGEIEGFPVALFTGSPSLESWYQTKRGIYKLVEFPREKSKFPEVSVIDMCEEKDKIFSLSLEKEIKKNLEKDNSILLFLNRRGLANFLLCLECGKVPRCPNCNISLTLHLKGKLICHYCGYEVKAPRVCPSCKGSHFRRIGLGTEQLEIEVKKRFPKVYVRRGDLDIISSSSLYKKLRSDLIEKKIDILVGTQLIIREEILSYVSLVGVVLADGLLNLPDFRAGEYFFQLLTKIRRLMKPEGKLIIQTYNPAHYTMQALRGKEESFYKRESQIREDLEYPPYLHWVRILLEGKIKAKVEKVAEALRKKVEKEEIEFLGPSPCPFGKIKGKYRYHLVLKSENLSFIRQILKKKLTPLFSGIQGVRGIVDVDPLRTM